MTLHEIIRLAATGRLRREHVAGLDRASLRWVQNLLTPSLRASPSAGNESNPASPDERLHREFLNEIASDRLREWWDATYTAHETAVWIARASDADLLAVQTLSARGFSLAAEYRDYMRATRRAEEDRQLAERRASAARAREAKSLKAAERLAAADPKRARDLLRWRKRNELRGQKEN